MVNICMKWYFTKGRWRCLIRRRTTHYYLDQLLEKFLHFILILRDELSMKELSKCNLQKCPHKKRWNTLQQQCSTLFFMHTHFQGDFLGTHQITRSEKKKYISTKWCSTVDTRLICFFPHGTSIASVIAKAHLAAVQRNREVCLGKLDSAWSIPKIPQIDVIRLHSTILLRHILFKILYVLGFHPVK